MARKPVHIKQREARKKAAFYWFDMGSTADELIAAKIGAAPQDVTSWRRDWDYERMQRRGKP